MPVLRHERKSHEMTLRKGNPRMGCVLKKRIPTECEDSGDVPGQNEMAVSANGSTMPDHAEPTRPLTSIRQAMAARPLTFNDRTRPACPPIPWRLSHHFYWPDASLMLCRRLTYFSQTPHSYQLGQPERGQPASANCIIGVIWSIPQRSSLHGSS